jgi:hypothetical protein
MVGRDAAHDGELVVRFHVAQHSGAAGADEFEAVLARVVGDADFGAPAAHRFRVCGGCGFGGAPSSRDGGMRPRVAQLGQPSVGRGG